MPFNWHKAHVKSILDRHSTDLNLEYVYKHGLGITSQVTNKDVNAKIFCISSKSNSTSIIHHRIMHHKSVQNSINKVLSRTLEIFGQLGVKKVLCPIPKSPLMNIDECAEKIKYANSNLDILSVHHMGSLL